MLMKLGLLSKPATSKLPAPPVCGMRTAPVSGTEHRTVTPTLRIETCTHGAIWSSDRHSLSLGSGLCARTGAHDLTQAV